MLLTTTVLADGGGFDHVAFCKEGKERVAKGNAEGPVQLDAFSVHMGVSMSCSERLMIFHTQMKVDPYEMPANWPEVKQRQWNSEMCSDVNRNVVANGWTLRAVFTFKNGFQKSFDANCASGS